MHFYMLVVNVPVLVELLPGLFIMVAWRNLEFKEEPRGGEYDACAPFPNKNLLYFALVSTENAQ